MEERGFELTLELQEKYQFQVDFGGDLPGLLVDEPEPLGDGQGPNAARLLAAAVANCLSASALFCLNKARVPVSGMRTTVHTSLARNEQGRLRIGNMQVEIHPDVGGEAVARVDRCSKLFEDFCIVTQSVRDGLEVNVEVKLPDVAEQTVIEPGRDDVES